MTRRQRDLILLLGSLLDAPFAQPKTWTGELVRRNAKRGEVGSKRVPCPVCKGDRWTKVRGFPAPCVWCGGDVQEGTPGRGWVEVDDYTRRQTGTLRTGLLVLTKTVFCDVCAGDGSTLAPRYRGENNRCLRCNGGGRIELLHSQWIAGRTLNAPRTLDAPLRTGDPVLDSMEARSKAGSYDELLLALLALHEAWPALYRLTRDRYVLGQELGSERLERLAQEGGLAFLDARMPERLLVPGGVRAREQEVAA